MTKTKLLELALLGRGYNLDTRRTTSRRQCFAKEGFATLWLGKAGGLRAGSTVTSSRSLERTRTYTALLNEGEGIYYTGRKAKQSPITELALDFDGL